MSVCNSVSEDLVTVMMLFSTKDQALNLERFSTPPSQGMLVGTHRSRGSFRDYQYFYFCDAESDPLCDLSFLGQLKFMEVLTPLFSHPKDGPMF